jgi:hypothetical protein
MKATEYTKEQEISALTELVGMKGFFAGYFGDDLECMCNNIRNACTIETGASFNHIDYIFHLNNKICDLEDHIHKQNERFALMNNEANETILRSYARTGDMELYNFLAGRIGIRTLITRKRALGLDVTNDEVDYLLLQNQE